jgi:hypothetical protein
MAALLNLVSFLPLIAAVVAVILVLFFAAPVLKACDLVPGRLWAIGALLLVGALASAGLHIAAVTSERDTAIAQRDEANTKYGLLVEATKTQKREAGALLKQLTDRVNELQAKLNDAHRAQEIKDANNQAAVDKARADLRAARAAHGGQLRDPNAATGRGCSGAGAEAGSGPSPGAGAADQAEAGGLLSVQLSDLLARLTGEADDINRAYAACRADAYTVRGLPAPADP